MNTYGNAILWYTTTWYPFTQHTLPWAFPTPSRIALLATTAKDDPKTATPAPAGLGLSRHHDRVPVQNQASALSPPPQGQCVIGSPDIGTLWLILQWQVSTT